jgi:DNA invertase Pin-like site-specific DNA recombinase
MSRKKKLRIKKRVIDPACRSVVAYVRRPLPNRRKDSIRRQREQIRKWAKKHGIEIVEEVIELGESKRQT